MRTRAERIAAQHLAFEFFFIALRTNVRLRTEEARNRKKIAMTTKQRRHKTKYQPPADQSPVALTPQDLANAIKRGVITPRTAMKIARRSRRR